MINYNDLDIIVDSQGFPVSQYFSEEHGEFAVETTDGSLVLRSDVDFRLKRLILDSDGFPLPQLWNPDIGEFVARTKSNNNNGGSVELINELDSDSTTAGLTAAKGKELDGKINVVSDMVEQNLSDISDLSVNLEQTQQAQNTLNNILKNVPKDRVDVTSFIDLVSTNNVPGEFYKDWTSAFQAAIDYLVNNHHGGTLYVPEGNYGITKTLVNNTERRVTIESDNGYFDVAFNINGSKARIFSHVNGSLFFGVGKWNFRNVACINRLSVTQSTNDVVFCDGLANNGLIYRCKVVNFDYVVKESISLVSIISENFFLKCRVAGISGSVVDSFIYNNYINGHHLKNNVGNADGISLWGFNASNIFNNFIDFCQHGIRVTTQMESSEITSNVIDYCYRGIKLGGVVGSSVSSNRFYHNSKKFYYHDNLNYPSEAINDDWIAIDLGHTQRGVTVTGNTGNDADLLINVYFYGDGNFKQLRIEGNANHTTDLDFKGNEGNRLVKYFNGNFEDDVRIPDMDYMEYTEEPNKYVLPCYSTVIYKNLLYRRGKGEIVDVIGLTKEFDWIPYDGNIEIDLPHFPSRSSVKLDLLLDSEIGVGKIQFLLNSNSWGDIFITEIERTNLPSSKTYEVYATYNNSNKKVIISITSPDQINVKLKSSSF